MGCSDSPPGNHPGFPKALECLWNSHSLLPLQLICRNPGGSRSTQRGSCGNRLWSREAPGVPTRQCPKQGHPKSEHGRDPPRSQGLPAPFPRLIPAFPSSLPVSQVWGEPGTRAEPVRGCSVPAAGWTQIKPPGNRGGQDGWTDGRADGWTLQSRARNTVFSTEILTSCIPKEAESASLLGDQLQLPLPSPEPARAPPGPDSRRIFKHQPSEFWGSLGVRIWATIHFQAVLTSSSSAGRLDLLITFSRCLGSWIGDLENICH